MATEESHSENQEHDDLDEDIVRLQIFLQDGENENGENDSELLALEQTQQVQKQADKEDERFSQSRPSTSSDVTASSFPTTSMCTETDDLIFKFDPSTITTESCLAMNRAYQEVLLDFLRQIEISLKENRTRQKQLSEEIDEECKTGKPSGSQPKFKAQISLPFFRDANGEIPPGNEDVAMKAQMKESKQTIKPKIAWPKGDRKGLVNAVRTDALEQLIRPVFSKLELEMSKLQGCKNKEEIEAAKDRIKALKETIEDKKRTPAEELLRTVNVDKIDFMKISVVQFKGKYEPNECESMWRNVLRPEINRDKWTSEEDEKLQDLVEKYKMRHWKKIAQELGTRRTPFQCLQHYQHNSYIFETSEWTTDEDELLLEVVEMCRFGAGKIQWNQVAYYMEGRSSEMCCSRWRQIDPTRKKGRWTPQEDQLLMTAVEMLGTADWLRIQEHVPSRNANQCRERWCNCLDPALKAVAWTYEEDKQLLKLFKKHGRNWAAIASHLSGRSDKMALQRHKRLMMWKKKSDEFYSNPRDIQQAMISHAFKLRNENLVEPVITQEDVSGNGDIDQKTYAKSKHFEYLQDFAVTNNVEILDYEKQIVDWENGDTIVPRPPPTKNFKSRTFAATWDRRKELQEMVQKHISTSLENLGPEQMSNTSAVVDHVISSLEPILKGHQADSSMLEIMMKQLTDKNPNEIPVKDLLEMKRKLTESLIPHKPKKPKKPRKIDKEKNSKQAKPWGAHESWTSSDESDEKEDGESSEEEEEEEIDEDNIPLEEAKVKKPLTQAQMAANAMRTKQRQIHQYVGSVLKKIVYSKMDQDPNTLRRVNWKTFTMYPSSVLWKQKYRDASDEERMKKKSLSLMMKTLDVNVKPVFQQAKESRKKGAAMALLKTAEVPRKRTRYATIMSQPEPDNNRSELAELVLGARQELGIPAEETFSTDEEVDVKPDISVLEASVKGGADQGGHKEEHYNKLLPFIPPNRTNIQALKALVLEHRCLVDSAGKYFNAEDLKNRLYSLKTKGCPNPLLGVFSAAGYKKIPGQPVAQVKTDQNKSGIPESQVISQLRQTKPYQQLMARFHSVFTWPALFATIKPPSDKEPLPKTIQSSLDAKNKMKLNSDDAQGTSRSQGSNMPPAEPVSRTSEPVSRNSELVSRTSEPVSRYSELVRRTSEPVSRNSEPVSTTSTAVGTSVTPVVCKTEKPDDDDGEEIVGKDLEADGPDMAESAVDMLEDLAEEEAIQQLVRDIRNKYKATSKNKRGRPRKMSVKLERAVEERERKRILKSLGLLEKLQTLQEKRLKQQGVAPGTSSQSFSEVREEPKLEAKPQMATSATQADMQEESGPKKGKRGRPVGSKNRHVSPHDENISRKSERVPKQSIWMSDMYVPPEKKEGTKKKKTRVQLQRLKEILPDMDVVNKISDIPLLREPQPEPKPKPSKAKKIIMIKVNKSAGLQGKRKATSSPNLDQEEAQVDKDSTGNTNNTAILIASKEGGLKPTGLSGEIVGWSKVGGSAMKKRKLINPVKHKQIDVKKRLGEMLQKKQMVAATVTNTRDGIEIKGEMEVVREDSDNTVPEVKKIINENHLLKKEQSHESTGVKDLLKTMVQKKIESHEADSLQVLPEDTLSEQSTPYIATPISLYCSNSLQSVKVSHSGNLPVSENTELASSETPSLNSLSVFGGDSLLKSPQTLNTQSALSTSSFIGTPAQTPNQTINVTVSPQVNPVPPKAAERLNVMGKGDMDNAGAAPKPEVASTSVLDTVSPDSGDSSMDTDGLPSLVKFETLTEDRPDANKVTMLMKVPITIDGKTQMAYVPLCKDKEGNMKLLSNAAQGPTSS